MKDLVSVQWLSENMDDPNLVLLDASLLKTADGKDSDLKNLTISGARIFDLKADFSDQTSPYTNTFPSEEQFEKACQKLGINKTSKIVVFDNKGIYSSPRVWWMFKVVGHENVAVLDGGLPEWVSNGFTTIKKEKLTYDSGDFKTSLNKELVLRFSDIQKNIEGQKFTLVDARSEGRFNGTADDPRKELQSGKIPGSVNIPFTSLLDNGKFKSVEDLQSIFNDKLSSDDQLAFTCGSGLTACIVALASEISFKQSRFIYDGSWTEWATRNGLLK